MLSKTSQYALRAVLYLARGPAPDAHVPAADIATALLVPPNYLSKILHALSRAGVVESERGPGGGYRLARTPESIPLASIVGAFDRIATGSVCLLGSPSCPGSRPCAAHERWRRVSDPLSAFFLETTVAELLQTSGAAAEPAPI